MTIQVRNNLIMRILTPADAGEVFSLIDRDREYLRQWLPWVDSTDSVGGRERTIAKWESKYAAGSDVILGIFKDERYIGNIGLHDIKDGTAEIGYWLAEGEQGQGIMTDCVRALMSYGFRELELERIFIQCAQENTKSRGIPERLGFRETGRKKDAENLSGNAVDYIQYDMTRQDFLANTQREPDKQ